MEEYRKECVMLIRKKEMKKMKITNDLNLFSDVELEFVISYRDDEIHNAVIIYYADDN